jgi:Tfp pilus assembly protein PilN
LPWILAALLMGVSLFGFLFVFAEYRSVNAKTEAANAKITKELEPKIKELKAEGERIKEALTPEQQKMMVAAHTLVARKQFSLSRLFSDLESVLPGNVTVSNISVRDVYREGDRNVADLDFAVFSRDYESVMAMINNMDSSGMFQAELRGQDLQRDKGNLSEYTLRLRYLPRYGVPAQPNTASLNDTAQNRVSEEAAR